MPKRRRSGDFKVRRSQHAAERPRFYLKAGTDALDPLVMKSCIGKRKIKMKKFAISRAIALTKREGILFKKYHCRACSYYHVGRQRDPVTREPIKVETNANSNR